MITTWSIPCTAAAAILPRGMASRGMGLAIIFWRKPKRRSQATDIPLKRPAKRGHHHDARQHEGHVGVGPQEG